MADDIAVLGIAASSQKGAVTVSRVIVRLRDGELEVEPMEAWQGTPRDEARSLMDLHDTLVNTLDRKRAGAPLALAIKRTESTRGRPTKQYDQKVRVEGVAMAAAASQGRRFFGYRTIQLGDGRELEAAAATHGSYPAGQHEQEATAAACAALAELLDDGELDS
jgi:hypothetical protein